MTSNSDSRPRIGIVTFPLIESGVVPLSNLVQVLCPLSRTLHIVTGNAAGCLARDIEADSVHFHMISHRRGTNAVTRIARFFWTQLRLSFRLARTARDVDVWFIFLGEGSLLLPVLTAKLRRRKVILVGAASNTRISETRSDVLSPVLVALEGVVRYLADFIVLYSSNLISEWQLEGYRRKVFLARKHFLDFEKFTVQKPFNERGHLVGYIGRLSQEKGVLEFLDAVQLVLKAGHDIAFVIVGDGQLASEVEKCVAKSKQRLECAGWIPHADLPHYLNSLRLLVLPSYTEGLPNIMLEAMACGTPVLATPVGAIPDVIVDGETGFLMEGNSPECIAENILRALGHPDLQRITRDARALVEREFTLEQAVERYRSVLHSVLA